MSIEVIDDLFATALSERVCKLCGKKIKKFIIEDKKDQIDLTLKHFCTAANGNAKITLTYNKKGKNLS